MRLISLAGAACGALALTLVACNSTDSTSSSTVQPSLGLITGADVVLKSLDGKVLATGATNAQGVVSFELKNGLQTLQGPFLVEVDGKAGAKYFDEGLNTDVDLPAGESLHAVVNTLSASIGVTTLTEVAYNRLLTLKGGKLATAGAADVNQANEEVRAQFAPELKSIVSAPQIVGSQTAAGTLDDDEGGRYALKLTALAKLAADGVEANTPDASSADDVKAALKGQRPALLLAKQLSSDFATGTLANSNLNGALYQAANFNEKLQDKLSQAVQQLGTDKLASTVNQHTAAPKPPANVASAVAGSQINLAILQTTDLHTNVKSYDYYKTVDDTTLGFERTATLIDKARQDNPNSLLVDDGDTIQGTSLSDYQALVNPVSCNTPLAIHKAMNFMHYDVGNVGNHEFNYGLPFLAQVTGASMRVPGTEAGKGCEGPKFPLVLANVFNAADKRPLFAPYVILNRTFTTTDGKRVPLKVGVIGFTPPPIMNWDKRNLDGKVFAIGVKEAAEKYVPEIRKAGADIVVALSHGGISDAPYTPDMENAVYYISQVPGVDAIVSGHSHSYFPDGVNYAGIKNVDNKKGLVNGVPTVMAGFWGKALGVLKLNLAYDGKAWKVADSQGVLQYINNKVGTQTVAVAAKPEIGKLVDKEHQGTIKYVTGGVGKTEYRISSFFSQVGPTSAMHLINLAQTDYVTTYIKANLPQYANLPVLSAAAPFKVNFRGTGFTDILPGDVAIKNVADLYLYPNTLEAVKIDGAALKLWLEQAAAQFNQIDPTKTTDQYLINSTFPSYNFDQIDGVTYEIDVTKPQGSRIVNLAINGQPVSPTQQVIVATNNYRASGGGGFAGLDGSKTIISGGDANRDIIVNYIKAQKTLTLANQGAVQNWRFSKVKTAGNVLFESSLDAAAVAVARQDKINNVFQFAPKADGTAEIFRIDLGM
ncbi:bifunctional 2',3'-cyclic-nucleotide 2'-phosphodiesterase/3'-nucleotidase [Andreprevotia chitinilytica]|uniref:bifunctional 2',3'-cyclic-nucleotide 2'-phosphodiesterase/3'-nucleotidase n=1 Tax=Andreprevotia chitinilytica TaxID=396808 RepID=UPI0012EB8677|nr:bifunctional 2',3'-cyclic-nucleotide 2'-phosphodiesterase/3'-nucleotidase [Andreprevotia chitinilytica]